MAVALEMSDSIERADVLCDVAELLIEYAGRTGQRARLMRDAAAWLTVLADPDTDERDLVELGEELRPWQRRLRERDRIREEVRRRLSGDD